jgi:CRP-like cAMP-binding protein
MSNDSGMLMGAFDMGDRVVAACPPGGLAGLLRGSSIHGVKRVLLPDHVLYEPDAPAEHVHLIDSGQIRLYQVQDDVALRLVEILGPDEWFGAAALAGQANYGFRAQAAERTELLEIPREAFLDALARSPGVCGEVCRELAARYQRANDDAFRLIVDDCHTRLIDTLLRFGGGPAGSEQNDEVVLRLTHQELAKAVGAARETVSLALTQLREQNLLRTGRNQLSFNPDSLRRFRGVSGRRHARA